MMAVNEISLLKLEVMRWTVQVVTALFALSENTHIGRKHGGFVPTETIKAY